jgi:hypothetical protein
MATPQELIDLSSSLMTTVGKIDAVVDKAPIGDPDAEHLSGIGSQLSAEAYTISHTALTEMVPDVATAVGQLNAQVAEGAKLLDAIDSLKKALNVTSVILTGAASIAASVATANWVGTADAVYTLVQNLQKSIQDNQPAAGGADGGG